MENRRSGLTIMKQLIGLIKPLVPIMLLAIFFGVIGFLCAIFLTILAGKSIVMILLHQTSGLTMMITMMIVIALSRGILHYFEQYCNHYIAFRLLAMIRHKVFAALRKLCPAKLEGKDKGNLISIITGDIELLEVFYAHTISPIAIAVIVSLIMIIYIASLNIIAGIIAFIAYLCIGVMIPLWNGKRTGKAGMEFRNELGNLNSFILDSMYGLDEIMQYDKGIERAKQINRHSLDLSKLQLNLYYYEGTQRAATNLAIQFFSWLMIFVMLMQYSMHTILFENMILCIIAMIGSFGPVVALSSLSNNLHQTLASGERVLSILEERPVVDEIEEGKQVKFDDVLLNDVTFSYDHQNILEDFSMSFSKGKTIGIHGPSGSGKSTILKLLMRFWDVNSGSITISDTDIKEIQTRNLRAMEAYVTQETWLFHDTIAKNIQVGNLKATQEEIEEAAKKANIHDFIMSLPQGYSTNVGELGDTLSGGERQRIGIARAFLHQSDLLLLDEPTSNLDSLNEGIILKTLKEETVSRTVILVSHRDSTMSIADKVVKMNTDRVS
ncbi:amino acid ABC transporter ATP-binding/permease protein [Eggerthia catenaformis]|uniref:amino acid ABC transporter ATP-binding/permease protein n=1 Tax=Eggerthia catenaformis TaxID=31973 RepID=UPI0004796422|nr:ABC transporter ATP-binding protein [Eggerthia catenaformis]